MTKGEAIRKGVATVSLVCAIGAGEMAISYEHAATKLNNKMHDISVPQANNPRAEALINSDNGVEHTFAALGLALLTASGLSGCEITGEYIVRAVRASREQEPHPQ